MATDADKDGALRRSILDDFTSSLESQPGMTPATRREATQLLDQALQDAANQPKSPAEVLAGWRQTVDQWNGHLEVMQKREEISATDAADIFRQFDQITQTLQGIQQGEPAVAAETAVVEAFAAPLPQGMPMEVAMALGQSVRKP